MRKHKNKNKIYSFLDVGRTPLVDADGKPVELQTYDSPKSSADIERREREAKNAAERAAHIANEDTKVRDYWSRPIEELQANVVGVRDTVVSLATGASHPTAGTDFIDELKAAGVGLTSDGCARVGRYMESQNLHLGASVTVANLHRAYQRLRELGCLDGEITEVPVAAPVAKPASFDEILSTTDGNSRDGAAVQRRALQDEVVRQEFATQWESWTNHMSSVWGVVLTKAMHQECWRLCLQRNLSPLASSTYDILRRHLSNLGFIAPSLTNREFEESRLNRGELTPAQFVQRCRTFELQGTLDKPLSMVGV
jgi:hypothetical protein